MAPQDGHNGQEAGEHRAPIDPALILDAAALEDRAQLSFWDALIVEAARRAGATRLVTEDLQDGRRIEGIAIQDPFGAAR